MRGKLDGRVAWDVVQLAQWWTSATQEARFALLTQATKENRPPLDKVRLAAFLAELEAGEVDQG